MSSAVVEGVSGGIGSMIATLSTYPLKTIYTLQALGAKESGGQAMTVLDVLRRGGLYAGVAPNLGEAGLSSAVYFFFYSKFKELALDPAAFNRLLGRTDTQLPANTTQHQQDNNQRLGVLASLLVATAAGACNQLATLPASTVATRMQVEDARSQGSRAGAPAARATTWGVITSIAREGGVLGFWRGLAPSLVLLANPAVQYMLYEQLVALMRHWKAQRLAARRLAAGEASALRARAEAKAAMAAVALQVVQRRRTVDSDEMVPGDDIPTTQPVQQAACIAAAAAAPACQAAGADGAAASATAAAPPPSSTAAVQLSAGEVFLASALAKIGATIVTYPLIVVKSRLQAGGGGGAPRYRGAWDAVVKTAQADGIGGFFNGLQAKILQTALNAALMLMIKEQLSAATRAALQRRSAAGGSEQQGAQCVGGWQLAGQCVREQLAAACASGWQLAPLGGCSGARAGQPAAAARAALLIQ